MDTGIRIPKGERAQFFYGDNIEGYFEGRTHETGGGSGYWLDGQPLLRDVLPRTAAGAQRREDATSAEILPHGIVHQFNHLSDELCVLHRQRAVACTIASRRKGKLGAALLFDPGAGEQHVRAYRDGIGVTFNNHRLAAGICADTPIDLSGAAAGHSSRGPEVTTTSPRSSLTIYIAFATTAALAVKRARALVKSNAREEHRAAIDRIVQRSRLDTGHAEYDRAVLWAKLTSYFLVTGEFGTGIWAGLPWFKSNWGRDTFIALPGTLLVSGLFDDARDVILNFLRYQDTNPASPSYGRVPNRVQSATDIIYNTADGTPWLIRELFEYLQYTGDLTLAKKVYPQVKLALEGAIQKFVDREGFLTHDDADTWMDARIEGNLPWSARGNRANDIQALWHNALLVGERLAHEAGDAAAAKRWRLLANKLRKNFQKRFWNRRRNVLADRITADHRRDEKNRPNQLMVLSIPMMEPLLENDQAEHVVRNAVGELLYPYGIASLSQRHAYFHPYHHNDAWHHFDAAYHNGTVWGWNAGFTITALCQTGHTRLAARLAKNLAGQILNMGCRGSMSELLEAIPRRGAMPQLSGTWAQAWSTSEFARNAYQDFAGFQPRLLDGNIHFHPHLPDDWRDWSATFPFGKNAQLIVDSTRWQGHLIIHVRMEGFRGKLDLCFTIDHGGHRYSGKLPLRSNAPIILRVSGKHLLTSQGIVISGVKRAPAGKLAFARPARAKNPPCLRKKNYLQQLIESGQFK